MNDLKGKYKRPDSKYILKEIIKSIDFKDMTKEDLKNTIKFLQLIRNYLLPHQQEQYSQCSYIYFFSEKSRKKIV